MSFILGLWGIAAGFVGFILLSVARSAVHEIEAAIALLIATVSIGCAGIIEAVNRRAKPQPASETVSSFSEPFYK